MKEIYNFPTQEKGSTVLLYPTPYCPVGCKYCFESPFLFEKKYDKENMKKTLEELMDFLEYRHLILHGGEVLKLPIKDFEYFIKIMKKHIDHPSIQSSLWGLTNKHIQIIKEYEVAIGASIDGPEELNSLRGPRSPELNKKFQEEINKNLDRLNSEGLSPGVISVLTKTNAGNENKLERLVNWSRTKTRGGRFNPMFVPNFDVNHPAQEDLLTTEEFKTAWMYILEASLKYTDFQPAFVAEMRDNLLGFPLASCTFSRCDYLTTKCITIMGDGGLVRCDRCLQDGYYYRSSVPTQQRSFMLKQTECKGCKYWEVCGGGCPGESLDKDFRKRSSFCETYYAVYERLESVLRMMYPNTQLSIDVEDFFNKYTQNGKILNDQLRLLRNSASNSPEHGEKSCSQNTRKNGASGGHIDHNDSENPYHIDGSRREYQNVRKNR